MIIPIVIVPVASLGALFIALLLYQWIHKQDVGDEAIKRISGYIREGAVAYLKRQYKTVAFFFAGAFVILLFVSYGLHALSVYVPYAFLTGGFFSGLSGFLGMLTATRTANRTTHAASRSLNGSLKISFCGGSVMGLVVVGFGLLDIILWFSGLKVSTDMDLHTITTTMLSFGFGASSMALFARVGGGIFTKAADMGADLVGKVEAGIPEDDPRNPAVIADNVGDNVGDIAGMGADLYESFVGSILGTAALAVSAFPLQDELRGVILPMLIAAIGTLSSVLGIFLVRTEEAGGQRGLLKAINKGINSASIVTILLSALVILQLMPQYFWQLFIPIIAGLLVGVAIGYATDYYTNAAYAPVKRIAEQAKTGHATVITAGMSTGLISTAPSIVFIVIGMAAAFGFGGGLVDFSRGLYAIGMAAVGMLSTLGVNLAVDAFGPIADNAGGIAEMSDMPSHTRQRTDALDELGNSTAARGKGLAIGAAALTAVTLVAAFVEEIRATLLKMNPETVINRFSQEALDLFPQLGSVETLHQALMKVSVKDIIFDLGGAIMDIRFIIGFFIGGVICTSFSSKTTQAVSQAAGEMIDEVRRQFREIKGVMTGKTTPDYRRCVDISTMAAQRKMISPAMIVMGTPIVTGMLLGPIALIGLLLGNLLVGFLLAIYMANAGGAWDNAKKYIERSKLALYFQLRDNLKKVSNRGLWPFFLTREYNRFLFELVNLNPLAFSIDEEVSEYLARMIDHIEKDYLQPKKPLTELKQCYLERPTEPCGDQELNKFYIKLNDEDKLMFREYLKLDDGDYRLLMEMKNLKEKYTVVMESYSAGVTGDTVGDPLKDTSGPSLNISIKLATMVSIITIGLVMRFNLYDLFF